MMINDFEIRVIAMQRSGHHAVINWISGLFKEDDRVCSLNDFSRFKRPKQQSSYYNFSEKEMSMDLNGEFVRKKALIMNFEEIYIRDFNKLLNESKYYPRGKSNNIFNILVLRDPHNMFASRYKKSINSNKKNLKRWIGENSISKWCEHAEKFLEIEQRSNGRSFGVSYNDWFESIEYRKKIALRLGLEFNDKNLYFVPKSGGGSSFDRFKKQNNAANMDVLDRWKIFSNNKTYNRIFDSEKLTELSKNIFGSIRE